MTIQLKDKFLMNTLLRTFKVKVKNYYYPNEATLLRKEIVLLISNLSSITFKELESTLVKK